MPARVRDVLVKFDAYYGAADQNLKGYLSPTLGASVAISGLRAATCRKSLDPLCSGNRDNRDSRDKHAPNLGNMAIIPVPVLRTPSETGTENRDRSLGYFRSCPDCPGCPGFPEEGGEKSPSTSERTASVARRGTRVPNEGEHERY